MRTYRIHHKGNDCGTGEGETATEAIRDAIRHSQDAGADWDADPDHYTATPEYEPEPGCCEGCGVEGYLADTTAGEIVIGGRVEAQIPAGSIPLLVGTSSGDQTDGRYCEECARD